MAAHNAMHSWMLINASLSVRKRATRRTACSCGPSSAAGTMTCPCSSPCSWRKGRYRELNPVPHYRTAVWPAAPETARARARPTPRVARKSPTMAAPADRARDTATGRPSASEPAGSSRYRRGSEVILFPVCALLLCAIRKWCWFWLNLTLWLADGWVMSQHKVLWDLLGRTCFSEGNYEMHKMFLCLLVLGFFCDFSPFIAHYLGLACLNIFKTI